jgi:serine protease inhibitor
MSLAQLIASKGACQVENEMKSLANPQMADLFSADAIAKASNGFGNRLLRQIGVGQSSNVILSPVSIWLLLAMARNWAGGATRTAMAKTLGIATMPDEEIGARCTALLKVLSVARGHAELEVANAVWLDSNIAINPDFIGRSQEIYQAEVRSLNFAHDPSGAAEVINQWVNHKTHGHIRNIVSSLAPATAHVLTNAVYFEGKWAWPFDQRDTALNPFHLGKYRSVTVPLMRQSRSFAYLETEQFQAVRLPYKGGQLEMCVFLPRNHENQDSGRSTLAELTNAIDKSPIKKWLKNPPSRHRPGILLFPRFELNYERTINADLHQLGMGVAFDRGSADFSLITSEPPPLCLDAVVHKIIMKVDETGTVAAGYTGGLLTGQSPLRAEQPFLMIVDRPFLCLIRGCLTGALLFVAAIVNPCS